MRDIVIIPTFFRPEYLTLCLEHIRAAQKGRELEIRVYHDSPRRANGYTVDATERLCYTHGVTFILRDPHHAIGNTYNFLDAYQHAYDSSARYVYLIEDDVLVGPDFFDWHEAVQARVEYFCSVAWHCIRNPQAIRDSPDPHAIVESAVDFSSIGVCWKRKDMFPLVRHACREYYHNPSEYLGKAFPDSPIPCNRWVEQAGLVMRMLLEGHGKRTVAWAGRPRCAHIGVSGYHRMTGPTYQNADRLRACIADGSFFTSASERYDDINALPEYKPWTPEGLYVAQRF